MELLGGLVELDADSEARGVILPQAEPEPELNSRDLREFVQKLSFGRARHHHVPWEAVTVHAGRGVASIRVHTRVLLWSYILHPLRPAHHELSQDDPRDEKGMHSCKEEHSSDTPKTPLKQGEVGWRGSCEIADRQNAAVLSRP
eukprot:2367454-Rhodomonas_salina.1